MPERRSFPGIARVRTHYHWWLRLLGSHQRWDRGRQQVEFDSFSSRLTSICEPKKPMIKVQFKVTLQVTWVWWISKLKSWPTGQFKSTRKSQPSPRQPSEAKESAKIDQALIISILRTFIRNKKSHNSLLDQALKRCTLNKSNKRIKCSIFQRITF